MTHEKQRIALAEWAGWKYSPSANSSIKHEAIMAWYRPGNSPWHLEQLPDYLNDLNAVHELLKPERFIPPGNPSKTGYWLELVCVCGSTENTAFATAAQRCEALLKTLNLWKP